MCRFSLLPLLSLFLLNEHIPSPHVLSEMYILHLSHRTVRGQCGAKEKNIGTTTFTHSIARVPKFQLTFTLLTSRADCKSPTRPHHSSRKRETNKGNNGARPWLPHIRKLERKYDLNLYIDCNVNFRNTQQRSRHMRCRFLKVELLPHLHLGPFQNLYIYHEYQL